MKIFALLFMVGFFPLAAWAQQDDIQITKHFTRNEILALSVDAASHVSEYLNVESNLGLCNEKSAVEKVKSKRVAKFKEYMKKNFATKNGADPYSEEEYRIIYVAAENYLLGFMVGISGVREKVKQDLNQDEQFCTHIKAESVKVLSE